MAPTKDELEQENAELRERNAELEQRLEVAETQQTGPAPDGRAQRPTDDAGRPILSEGERQELEVRGVATSPFDGSRLNALDEGVEPTNPVARARATRAQRAPEVVPGGGWPLAGPPPAEGGDTDPGSGDAGDADPLKP